MGNPMTKNAFNEMIDDDIAWLETCTNHSVEKMHIIDILKSQKTSTESSRSPGCYFVDLAALKGKLVECIKLMEPDDGDEWHDETAHEISQRVATFFDDMIFDLEQTK